MTAVFFVVALAGVAVSWATGRSGWGFLGTATALGIGLVVMAVLESRRRGSDRQ
jgi:hypothetical protein